MARRLLYSASWITQDLLLNSKILKDNIKYICDGDEQKQGHEFMNITVGKPKQIAIDSPDIIIITSSYFKEIKSDLINLEYQRRIISHMNIIVVTDLILIT